MMKSSIIALAAGLLSLSFVAASNPMVTPAPELRRRDDSDPLAPWLTVKNGEQVMVTPVVTTNSAGSTTTLNARPTDIVVNNATNADGVITPKCDSKSYTNGGPFCLPSNGTLVKINTKFLITWDPDFWQKDVTKGSVTIFLYAVDKDDSDPGTNSFIDNWAGIDVVDGVKAIDINSDWMHGKDNRTVRFDIRRTFETGYRDSPGPMVILTTGKQPSQPKTRPPRSTIAIAVVLPLTVALVLLIIWAVFHFNRGERAFDRKGLRAKLGSKKFKKDKGYGERKSRAQRMGPGGGPMSPADEGDEDWEMTNMSGGGTTATGGFSNAPRERTKASPNNPFSDDYAR